MSSEAQILKSGNVLLKSGGIIGSKKKKWCVMCTKGDKPPWLDFYENQDQSHSAQPKNKKTYQLNQVRSIDKIVKGSSKDYYIDIHFKKGSITMYFDSENEVEAWNNALQIFVPILGSEGSGMSQFDMEEDDGSTFRPNVLYDSSEDTISFDVKVGKTDGIEKHHLSLDKPHKLHVTLTNLSLENEEGKLVLRWPYEYIRNYGSHKSTGTFNITSGRKADAGEGQFQFHLSNPTRVTQAIDLQTARKYQAKQKAQLQAEAIPLRTQSLNISSTGNKEKESGDPKRSSQKHSSSEFERQLSEVLDPEKNAKRKSKEKKQEEKKGSFSLFGNKKKDKKDSKHEVEAERSSEGVSEETEEIPEDHIYDVADPSIATKTKNSVRPPAKVPPRNGSSGKPPVAKKPVPRPSVNDDDMYDCLAPKGGARNGNVKKYAKGEENLYGSSSGRPLNLEPNEEGDYDDTGIINQEDEVEYDDATSAPFRIAQITAGYPSSAYEEVDCD